MTLSRDYKSFTGFALLYDSLRQAGCCTVAAGRSVRIFGRMPILIRMSHILHSGHFGIGIRHQILTLRSEIWKWRYANVRQRLGIVKQPTTVNPFQSTLSLPRVRCGRSGCFQRALSSCPSIPIPSTHRRKSDLSCRNEPGFITRLPLALEKPI